VKCHLVLQECNKTIATTGKVGTFTHF